MNDTNSAPEPAPEPQEPSIGGEFLDSLQLISDNLRLILLAPLVLSVLVFACTYLITPSYTALVRIMPPPQQSQGAAAAMLQSLGTLGAAAGASAGLKNSGDLYTGLLKSRSVLDSLIDKFNLLEKYDLKEKEATRKELLNRTRVVNGKDSIITVEIDDSSPEVAAQMADAYINALGSLLSRISLSEAQMRRGFFEKQMATTKANLEKAELLLKSSGGVSANALKLNPGFAVGTSAQIKAQMTGLEIKLVSMRGYLSETSPEYRQVLTELAALQTQMEKIEKDDSNTVKNPNDYLDKYRDFKYHETLYELLIRQFDAAKLDESREGNVMQIVDYAVIPERKSKPKRAIITLLSGFTFGMLLLLFLFAQRKWQAAKLNPEFAEKLTRLKVSSRLALTRKKY